MSHSTAKHAGDGDHVKESAVALKDAVVDLASQAGAFASHRVSDAKESAAAMIDSVKERAGEYNTTVVGFVRKHPYKSLAIAAGVGLVTGLLLRRR